MHDDMEGTLLWENLRRAFWGLPVFCETRSGYYLSLLLRWRKCEREDRLRAWESRDWVKAFCDSASQEQVNAAYDRDLAKLRKLCGPEARFNYRQWARELIQEREA